MKKKSKRRSDKKIYKKKRKNEAKSRPVSSLFKFSLLILAVGFVIYQFMFRSPKGEVTITSNSSPEKIERTRIERVEAASLNKPEYNLKLIYNEFGILDEWISMTKNVTHIRLPDDFADVLLIHRIINKLQQMDCDILQSTENLTTQKSTLKYRDKEGSEHIIVFSQEATLKQVQGKIAIIIDDFGYNEDDAVKKLIGLPQQITIAVLPGLAKSRSLYEQVQANRKETIIHLPMEADEQKVDYTAYTLYANMRDDEIRERVRKALSEFPESKGMNNHMGSRITADKRIMSLVMQELKNGAKYFIDSKTTPKSVAYETARELNVPSAENDLFLERDRNDNPEYLRKKLAALTKIASKRGYAVAIGHPYQTTVQVLIEELPKLEKQGFVLVPVSEIVK